MISEEINREVAKSAKPDANGLPEGWVWTTIGKLTDSMKNGIYKPAEYYVNDGIACLRMYNIDAGRIVWKDIKRMRLTPQEVAEYELRPGDLLVNRVNSRELVGKAAVIPDGLEPMVYESKNIRVRLSTTIVSSQYVGYWFQYFGQHYFGRNAQQTVGMASTNQVQLAAMPIPLPPLSEQQLIVSKVDESLTRLEAGVASLKRVQAALKRYRAAVLKAACEGRLVPQDPNDEPAAKLLERILAERRACWEADLRAKGKDPAKAKYEEPAAPETDGLPELPEGWCWATLDQLGQEGRPVIYGIIKPGPHVPAGVPYVRVTEMKDGHVDVPSLRRTSPERAAKFARATLSAGDVLISKDGTIGRVAVVPPELEGGNITQHVMRAPVHHSMSRNYVVWAIRSPVCQRWLTGETRGVALRGVNVEDFRRLPIPVPALAEQERIIAEVERRTSVLDALQHATELGTERAERLRQAVLRRAFEGGLIA
jgi:type I restriction enzyme, S subunit